MGKMPSPLNSSFQVSGGRGYPVFSDLFSTVARINDKSLSPGLSVLSRSQGKVFKKLLIPWSHLRPIQNLLRWGTTAFEMMAALLIQMFHFFSFYKLLFKISSYYNVLAKV